jgi:RND family efflux transporter MFP subunit
MNDVQTRQPAETRSAARRVWWTVGIVSLAVVAITLLAGLDVLGKKQTGADSSGRGKSEAPVVKAVRAGHQDLTLRAEYRGELEADVAELASQSTGRLKDVKVGIGDRFDKGDVLALVDAVQAEGQVTEAQAQVGSADATIRRTTAQLRAAKVELDRGRLLHKEQLVTQQELDALASRLDVLEAELDAAEAQRSQAQARTALLRQQVTETRLIAPFDGAVAERYLDTGSLVQPGVKVLRLVRSGPLRVSFKVPESDVGRIAQGMPMQVTAQAAPDRGFDGKVTRISAEVSRLDRSAGVEGVLAEETSVLRPGMYAEVLIVLGELKNVVTVPAAALVDRSTPGSSAKTGVFVIEPNHARFRSVKVLGRTGDRAAVGGISAGVRVITLGHETLRDGTAIRVAAEGGK